jgi:hypothetical protein
MPETEMNNPRPIQSEHHTHHTMNNQTNEGQNTTGPLSTDQCQQIPQNQKKQNQKKLHRTQASIQIATLNMNGCHTNHENRTTFKKWSEIMPQLGMKRSQSLPYKKHT